MSSKHKGNGGGSTRQRSRTAVVENTANKVARLEQMVLKQGEVVYKLAASHDKIIQTVNALALHVRELPNNPAFLAAMVGRLDEMLNVGENRLRTGRIHHNAVAIDVAAAENLDQTHKVARLQRIADDEDSKLRRCQVCLRQPNNDGTKFGYVELTDEDTFELGLQLNFFLEELETMEPDEYRFYELVPEATKDPAGMLMEVAEDTIAAVIHSYPLIARVSKPDELSDFALEVASLVDGNITWTPTTEAIEPRLTGVMLRAAMEVRVGEPIYYAYVTTPDTGVIAGAHAASMSSVDLADIATKAEDLATALQGNAPTADAPEHGDGNAPINYVTSLTPFEGADADDAVVISYHHITNDVLVSPQQDPMTAIQLSESATTLYQSIAQKTVTQPAGDTVSTFYLRFTSAPAEHEGDVIQATDMIGDEHHDDEEGNSFTFHGGTAIGATTAEAPAAEPAPTETLYNTVVVTPEDVAAAEAEANRVAQASEAAPVAEQAVSEPAAVEQTAVPAPAAEAAPVSEPVVAPAQETQVETAPATQQDNGANQGEQAAPAQ